MNRYIVNSLFGVAALVLAATTCAQAPKPFVQESATVDSAFSRWYLANRIDEPLRLPLTAGPLAELPMLARVASAPPVFEPQPVILGLPDVPLLGSGASAVTSAWNNGFNYQAMNVSFVVVDSAANVREFRALNSPLTPGVRFKVRVVATFDGFAHVDQIGGEVWRPQRLGQLYPAAGSVVQLKAGETVDLPIGSNNFFVMGADPSNRISVTVRDTQATSQTRSAQPLYRQDARGSSNLYQLVPKGTRASFEFISAATVAR